VASGVHIVIADRQVELAEEVAADIGARGGSAVVNELDVRVADRFREVVQTIVSRMGRLDYLFNNAGIGVGGVFEKLGHRALLPVRLELARRRAQDPSNRDEAE
jgi:NAD(P)-dependent dehydrogenase (short-subunit alcohol dehydrogenase family)